MRRFLPQSLAARTLATLTIGFAVLFAAMVGIHDVLLRHAVERGTEELLAQRLATILDAVASAPEGDRDRIAHALSRADLEVHWRRDAAPTPEHPSREEWPTVAARTAALSSVATELRVRPGRYEAASDRLANSDDVGSLFRRDVGR